MINGVYIGMHYYAEWKQSEMQRQEEKKIRAEGFTAKNGKQNLLIPFNDILGFYAAEGYTVLRTWKNKKYFPDKSLDKIFPSAHGIHCRALRADMWHSPCYGDSR